LGVNQVGAYTITVKNKSWRIYIYENQNYRTFWN
jgi:hypothetical protein